MYCVIQEIELKKQNKHGHSKELISEFMQMSVSGKDCSHYWHRYSEECFERPIKKAYKISLHQSHREQGKVIKKQYPICTVNYYDIADRWFNVYDYCDRKIAAIAQEQDISTEELYDMVEKKLSPLMEKIQSDYMKTEEYIVHTEHERITTLYAANKAKFNEKYGGSRYEEIYDVFGNLMDKEKLNELEIEYKDRQEYEEKSRSYQKDFYSNYSKFFSGRGNSSYSNDTNDNYSSDDKETLKQFYRELSKKFHPDANPDMDTSKQMKLLNQLKGEWGL